MDTAAIINWCFSTALGGIAAFIVIAFYDVQEEAEAAHLLAGLTRARERRGLFLKLFGGLVFSLGELFAKLPLGERRARLAKRLIAAGTPGGLSADEFAAARLVAFVLGGLCGAYFDSETELSPVLTTGMALLGFFYPDIWLSGAIQKRRRRIFRDLPDFLDALRLSVDAGLDLNSALKVCVEKGKKGPLLDEFEKVERDITLGRTRKEAFRSFADRIGMTEINSFVIALLQADQLGASIGPILRIQAEVARTRRWQLAEVIVNKMPMKMLGPLVLLIFPASFVVLFTPLIIQYLQSMD